MKPRRDSTTDLCSTIDAITWLKIMTMYASFLRFQMLPKNLGGVERKQDFLLSANAFNSTIPPVEGVTMASKLLGIDTDNQTIFIF